MIKSGAGGERRTIGLLVGVGFANKKRAEHNDPEGAKPRRGVKVREEFAGAGLVRWQRVASADTDHPDVDMGVGRGAQRPNGLLEGPVECRRGRPGVLILPRLFPKGNAAAGE